MITFSLNIPCDLSTNLYVTYYKFYKDLLENKGFLIGNCISNISVDAIIQQYLCNFTYVLKMRKLSEPLKDSIFTKFDRNFIKKISSMSSAREFSLDIEENSFIEGLSYKKEFQEVYWDEFLDIMNYLHLKHPVDLKDFIDVFLQKRPFMKIKNTDLYSNIEVLFKTLDVKVLHRYVNEFYEQTYLLRVNTMYLQSLDSFIRGNVPLAKGFIDKDLNPLPLDLSTYISIEEEGSVIFKSKCDVYSLDISLYLKIVRDFVTNGKTTMLVTFAGRHRKYKTPGGTEFLDIPLHYYLKEVRKELLLNLKTKYNILGVSSNKVYIKVTKNIKDTLDTHISLRTFSVGDFLIKLEKESEVFGCC